MTQHTTAPEASPSDASLLTATVSFRHMKDRNQADSDILLARRAGYKRALPERVLAHLELLKGDTEGFLIDRYEHSLQTATRAYRDGRDEEYVVCALLHDIGDTLASFNHADLAAAVLKPFVSPQNHWIVEKHNVFQGYYFFHFTGRDRNARDRYRDHPWFDSVAEFCDRYDGASFDPDYESLPLIFFKPMVERLFAKPKWGPHGQAHPADRFL